MLRSKRVTPLALCFVFCAVTVASAAQGREEELETRVIAWVKTRGGNITRTDDVPGKPITKVDFRGTQITEAELKELLGLDFLDWLNIEVTDRSLAVMRECDMLHVLALASNGGKPRPASAKQVRSLCLGANKVSDQGLKELVPLKNLTYLNLSGTKVTDTGLKELAAFKKLTELCLCDTAVTDRGLKELAQQKNLTSLLVFRTEITNAGMKELASLTNLTTLGLNGTKVSDAGLKELASLRNLTTLHIGNTQVTDKGIRSFQEALPKCEVLR